MPKIFFFVFFAFFTVVKTEGQIKLPKGFHYVLGGNYITGSYFTNGVFSYSSYFWGISGQAAVNAIELSYDHQIKLKKTNDGLYWATGKIGNEYVSTILLDEVFQFTLSSKINNAQFSNYSTWLLQQIRKNKAAGIKNYFTDYKGKE